MKTSPKGNANGEYSALDLMAMERLEGKEAVSLQVLVGDLARDLGYATDRVTEGIMALQSRKVIVITEKTPFGSLASYAASPISLWFWAAVGATVLSVVFLSVTSGVAVYIRYAFGSLLVLFLPGYSLIETLYPNDELDDLTRFALSVGLSLALVPLIGLALNYTPAGIKVAPVAISLSCFALFFLFFALNRRYAHYRATKNIS